MEKLKIKGFASEDYSKGRIDSFTIPLTDNLGKGVHHSHIIPLFCKFGMSKKDAVTKLDVDFKTYPAGTSFFIYISSNLRVHIIIEEQALCLEFDTSLPKEEINSTMKKYFKFPEKQYFKK